MLQTDRAESENKMKWSWKLGEVAGVELRIHATFLLLLAWVGASHWILGRNAGDVVAGLLFIAALFGCVVLHELGHALTACRYGIPTRDITLLPIGGVARLERMPEQPVQELWVALAGPAVNVGIAAVLYVWLTVTSTWVPPSNLSVATGPFVERLLLANVWLVLFNLIPAFPMDGGRVLRALLASRLEYVRATQIAASVGQVLAFVFAFVGLFTNPILLFIALFVWIGATQEAGATQMKAAITGTPVRGAMLTDFRELDSRATLDDAVRCVLEGSQQDFPIVDNKRDRCSRPARISSSHWPNMGRYTPFRRQCVAISWPLPLVRRAEALEVMEKVDTSVVDKTGTLTEGKPRLVTVRPTEGLSEAELLRFAASLEQASEHPLAAAIVQGTKQRSVPLAGAEDFRSVTGKGAVARVDGRAVAVGNFRLLQDMGIDAGPLAPEAEALRREGQTVVFVALDGKLSGLLGVADPVRSTTPAAIAALHKAGIRVVMLTGDNRTTAEAVARSLGIDEVQADVLPEDKARVTQQLQASGRTVAMAGDGVNDAPALAQADVGIAMGTGTDVAMETAGIVLVRGDLRGIVRARHLSRATMKNIRQNLFFAFVYNVLGVPVAAGALYPFFGILLSPMIASAAMTLSSVSVIANALRLRRVEL
jgi:Zn-dependent protease/soluble P-type ATPase